MMSGDGTADGIAQAFDHLHCVLRCSMLQNDAQLGEIEVKLCEVDQKMPFGV